MNPAVVIGIVGAIAGVTQAAFSLGLSRSPAWPESRPFALVAVTAAGYCLFDLGLVLDVPPHVAATLVQIAFAFGTLHGVAWLRYLAAADRRPLRPSERWLIVVGLAMTVGALVPGFLVTTEIVTFRINWVAVTYHTPQPTMIGLAIYLYFVMAFVVVLAGAMSRWREGWQARFPVVGVAVLAALSLNDTLASAEYISMPLLLDAGSIVVVIVTGLLHQLRFGADVHRLELSSTELEYEIAVRTREQLETQAALARIERLASVGRLTAGVAHEINNPIAVVLHNLEQLQVRVEGQRDQLADLSAYVDGGLLATHRIIRIVRQLLDAGRGVSLDPGRLVPFAVTPVVRRALRSVEDTLGPLNVVVDVEPGLAARGDAAMVEQVLINLVTNAAHALEAAPAGRIEVRAVRAGDRARISVADNGPGLSASVRERLFEPFVSTKPVGKGSGFGLAVSQGLMRSQQGELKLAHTSELGTEMAIELAWSPEAPIAPPASGSSEPAGRSRLRVLIIDDDEAVRSMLHDLMSRDYCVELAASVGEACERIVKAPPVDFVFCDLMMPDGGAEAWLARCSGEHSFLAERTIIITGGPTTAHAAALINANADRVLYKPFALADMRAMVARVLSGRPRA